MPENTQRPENEQPHEQPNAQQHRPSLVFRLPTALDWAATTARLLARVDAVAVDETLVARFFVDDRAVGRVDISRPENAGAAAATVREIAAQIASDPGFPGTDAWAFRGAVDFRPARSADVSSDRIGQGAGFVDLADYSEHRTRAELGRFLHYVHFIPVGRGLTDAFVDDHYPGRTWQGLTLVLRAAGVLIGRGSHPPECLPTVRTLHFTDAAHWCVEWADGSVSASAV